MSIITGKTKLLGIIGDPVQHSLSPVMHNAAISHLGVDYIYLPFPIKPKDLTTAIAGFTSIGIVGFNVTIPYKQAIIPLLSEVTPTAELVGAVNTVWRTETGWKGTNTDIDGFLSPLQSLQRDWANLTPIILGNGGAARAVVVGLAQLGCLKIYVVGRDRQKLWQFTQSWKNTRLTAALGVYFWDKLSEIIEETELLINTTPIGMSPNIDDSPVESMLFARMPENAIAYDLIYTPNPTQFLKNAKQQGLITIDGLEMLVRQGAVALQLWLQKPVPVDVMTQSLRDYLKL
ncbi:MAG: shikimate dehydrogenase [cyanobacterium endosymbiont of Rhopalodia musculus]|uniref:shikimate dehydrogenase n=1 Tax=cyanobacterium endosymbiont of Epithemia clementina EcSB TaxID=3034674 RepID=UPI00247FF0CC|nr:shikimate dehydrogenase [cyanobacterium endosymbiont of Epithemia clementina EcSB]WGT66762.1 shikimate dehydrogenase [cyanobacterium endosymbiont of Epithemia clementina EcSB]